MPLIPRWCDDNDFNNDCDDNWNSPWWQYGRWILLAVIIIGAFLIFLAFACITARRRRNANLQPYPLTGWASGGPRPQQEQGYGGYYGDHQAPAPPPYQANQGYYGKDNAQQPFLGGGAPAPSPYAPYGSGARGQETGVELSEPSVAHHAQHGGADVYQPPAGPPPGKSDDATFQPPPGPPPGKSDGIIR